jgi:hypothetical protein
MLYTIKYLNFIWIQSAGTNPDKLRYYFHIAIIIIFDFSALMNHHVRQYEQLPDCLDALLLG